MWWCNSIVARFFCAVVVGSWEEADTSLLTRDPGSELLLWQGQGEGEI